MAALKLESGMQKKTGYAKLGFAKEALKLHQQMEQEGVKSNEVTFLGMLQACSELGALKQGKRFHAQILTTEERLCPTWP